MSKSNIINVKGVSIKVLKTNLGDYISLTDMIKAKDGEVTFRGTKTIL